MCHARMESRGSNCAKLTHFISIKIKVSICEDEMRKHDKIFGYYDIEDHNILRPLGFGYSD